MRIKRSLSALLAAVMVLTMLPLQALAKTDGTQLGLLEPDDNGVYHFVGLYGGYGRDVGKSVAVGVFEDGVLTNAPNAAISCSQPGIAEITPAQLEVETNGSTATYACYIITFIGVGEAVGTLTLPDGRSCSFNLFGHGTAPVTEPQLQMHVRVWDENGNETVHVTSDWSYPVGDWWDARFFMVYPDGTQKEVDPYDMGRTSEIDLISVDKDGWAEHRTAHVGPGLIEYQEANAYTNGAVETYRVKVQVHYPDLGMYDAMPFDESSLVNKLTVAAKGDTYYIALSPEKIADGLRMSKIHTTFGSYINDPSLTEVADVTLSNDGTYAKVVFFDDSARDYFHFEADMVNAQGEDWGRWGRSVKVENDIAGLYFCYARRNDDTERWELNFNQIDTEWYTIPGYNKIGAFYFDRPSVIRAGGAKALELDDLDFRYGLEADEFDGDDYDAPKNLVIVECTDFTTKPIKYDVNGLSYYMDVITELPEVGFYTKAEASEGAFIHRFAPFTVTEDERVFYICPEDPDETEILSVGNWSDGGGKLFDTSVASDGSSVKVTVRDGAVVGNDSYELEVEYIDDRGRTQRDGVRVYVENGQPALMFRHLEWNDKKQEYVDSKDNPMETVVDFDLGEEFPVQFYYGTEDDCIKVDLDELTFPKGVVKGYMREGVQWLEGTGYWEEGYIEYTNPDGAVVKMFAVSEQPSIGFYSNNIPSKSAWLDEEIVMDTKNPVYLITRDDIGIDKVTEITEWRYSGGKDMLDWFDIQIAPNGSYAEIRIKEGPDGELPMGSHYDIQIRTAQGWNMGRSFTLVRGDLKQLAVPHDLEWHVDYERNGNNGNVTYNKVKRMGMMSFSISAGELSQNEYEFELYSAADGYTTPVLNGSWGFGDDEEILHFSMSSFIYEDLPSGTYKFRVRAVGDGRKYRNSEWSELSDEFNYTQPKTRLATPDNDDFYWKKVDGRYAAVVPASELVQDGAGYFEIQWYFLDEDGRIEQTGGSFDMRVGDDLSGEHIHHIHDEIFEEHGNTEYYFTVRVIPSDITQYRPSKESGYSPALTVKDIANAVNGKLDNLLGGNAAPTVEDVQNALISDTADLRTAMAADQSIAGGTNSGTLDRIAQLEKSLADNVDQKVEAKNSAPQAIRDIANGITMIGATLNLADKNPETGKTPTVTLEIDEPKEGIVISEQQHNAVQFSMKLNGAIDKDDKEQAGQQLIVPVAITMPVPENINPDFLVVLHKKWDGEIEQMRPFIYKENGVYYARFIVDSFSDFALVEDRSLDDGAEEKPEKPADPEYTITIDRIELVDPFTKEVLSGIPTGTFETRVYVENLPEGFGGVVMLGCYDKAGRMVQLEVMGGRTTYPDGTCYYDLQMTNDGEIYSIKAMPVDAFGSFVPVAVPKEIYGDGAVVPPAGAQNGYVLVEDSYMDGGRVMVEVLHLDGTGSEVLTSTADAAVPYGFYDYNMTATGEIELAELRDAAQILSGFIKAEAGNPQFRFGDDSMDLVMDNSTRLHLITDDGVKTIEGYHAISIWEDEADALVVYSDRTVEDVYVVEGRLFSEHIAYYDGAEDRQVGDKRYLTLWVGGEAVEYDATEIFSYMVPSAGAYKIHVKGGTLTAMTGLAYERYDLAEVTSSRDKHFDAVSVKDGTAYDLLTYAAGADIFDLTTGGAPIGRVAKGDKIVWIEDSATGLLTHIWVVGRSEVEPEAPQTAPAQPEGYVLVTDSDLVDGAVTVEVLYMNGTGREVLTSMADEVVPYGFYAYYRTTDGLIELLSLGSEGRQEAQILSEESSAPHYGTYASILANVGNTEGQSFVFGSLQGLVIDKDTRLHLVKDGIVETYEGYKNIRIEEKNVDALVVYDGRSVKDIYVVDGRFYHSHYAYYNGDPIKLTGLDTFAIPMYVNGDLVYYDCTYLLGDSMPVKGMYKIYVKDDTLVGFDDVDHKWADEHSAVVDKVRENSFDVTYLNGDMGSASMLTCADDVEIFDLTQGGAYTDAVRAGDTVIFIENDDAQGKVVTHIWIIGRSGGDMPTGKPYFVDASTNEDTVILSVKGELAEGDYVEVLRADDGWSFGMAEDLGINEMGYHAFSFENPYAVDQTFTFRLIVGGEEVDTETVSLMPMVPDTPTIQNYYVEGNVATLTVYGPMGEYDRIMCYTWNEFKNDYLGEAVWEYSDGNYHVFTFENTTEKDLNINFRLMGNGGSTQVSGIELLVPGKAAQAHTMTITVDGNKATVAVTGDLTTADRVAVHALIDDEYEELGDAAYEMLGDGVTYFSFENTMDAEYEFLFQLWVGDECVTYEYVNIAKATHLLPTGMHLEYNADLGLALVMTKPTDPSLVSGNITWTYDINNGQKSTIRTVGPKVGATAFMTNYGLLSLGENTVKITMTAYPSAEAEALGYGEESTSFTADILYTKETTDFDTSNIRATFEEAETEGMKRLTVTGLRPNQSYEVSVYTGDEAGHIMQKRELTTDANGTGTSTWYTDYDFTYCTIAEFAVADVTDTSATIIRRPYDGEFRFGEEDVSTGTMWIDAYAATMNLYWSEKPDYTGHYYVNGKTVGAYAQKWILNDVIPLSTNSTLSYKIEVDGENGQKEIWIPETEMITVEIHGKFSPDLSIVGQENGSYKLVPNDDFTGRYIWSMLSPEGAVLASGNAAAGGTINVAPYEGCYFEVSEASWTTGAELDHVTVSKTGSTIIRQFTPYDFSDLVTHVTDEASFSAAMNKGGTVIMDNNITIQNTKICAGGDVELDLNGYTLNLGSSNSLTVYDGKTVIIVDNSGANGEVVGSAGINVSDGAMLSAIDCSLQRIYSGNLCRSIVLHNAVCNKADFYGATRVTLENSTLGDVSGQNCGMIDISGSTVGGILQFYGCPDVEISDCDLTVSSPVFTNNSTTGAVTNAVLTDVDCTFQSSGIRVQNGSSLTIHGGTYTQQYTTGYLFNVDTTGTVTVTSGTFNMDPSAYLAEGVTVTETDGLWVVGKTIVEDEPAAVYTMEITVSDARADIAVYAEDMSMVDRVEVHAWVDGEYEYVADAAYEMLGDGVIYFSFENPYAYGCKFLFRLWAGDEVAEWQTALLPGYIDSSDFVMEVITDGSTATITITGTYPEDARLEAVANVDGAWGKVGEAAHVSSFGDLHTYTYTYTEPVGRDFVFRLMVEETDILSSDTCRLEGLTTGEW